MLCPSLFRDFLLLALAIETASIPENGVDSPNLTKARAHREDFGGNACFINCMKGSDLSCKHTLYVWRNQEAEKLHLSIICGPYVAETKHIETMFQENLFILFYLFICIACLLP